MASLNEIKSRINSVNSTMKITSAMMMVSSAKLTRAQGAIGSFLPYQEKLDSILTNILSADTGYESPFTVSREVKRTAIVVCSSNGSLCGAYNSNIIKRFRDVYKDKKEQLGADNILIYPVGKKVADAVKKANLKIEGEYQSIADKPTFEESRALAKELIDRYISKKIDEVVIVYSHFISAGSQKLLTSQYLPFDLSKQKSEVDENQSSADYIFEPSKAEILDSLIPTVLNARLFAAFLDANASEYAARMVAMQTATDNAKELNEELTIQFNKQRQQEVTNQLLDIIGGANALS